MTFDLYKCFIASPSDTAQERAACDEVLSKINRTLGDMLSFRVESLKWENDVSPGFGDEPQDVINKRINDDYDIFIGIMWNRFGEQTKSAGSGTEEEFNRAYKRMKSGDDVEILFYFSSAPSDVLSQDLSQISKIQNFMKRVSDLGGLYCRYGSLDEFRESLERHLADFFVKRLGSRSKDKAIKDRSDELKKASENEAVSIILRKRLNDALFVFHGQPSIWIDPVIVRAGNISKNPDDNFDLRVDESEILSHEKSLIVRAPPQFGLSCLAHHLVLSAWNFGKVWIYVDARRLYGKDETRILKREIRDLNLEGRLIDCIVIDSWNVNENGAKRLIKNIGTSDFSVGNP